MNEKYLIILFGQRSFYSRDIYILDLDINKKDKLMEWKKSIIIAPQSVNGNYWNVKAVLTYENEDINRVDLLLSGLIRRLILDLELDNDDHENININESLSISTYTNIPMILPIDIVKIIRQMYKQEYIHTIRPNSETVKDSCHFKINVADILQTVE